MFLQKVRDRADTLYIIGDLFDFWFEYRSVILKKHFTILHHLAQLTDAGVTLVYVAGNHDFWLGDFLQDRIGASIAPDPLTVEHQGKKIFIAHGDGLITKDRGYRMLKWVLRFPPHIWLFKLLHPDLGDFLARCSSRFSRRYLSKEKKFDFNAEYRRFAYDKFRQDLDAVILGHSHLPFLENTDGRYLINAGNWIKDFSYVVLEEGKFELKYWE